MSRQSWFSLAALFLSSALAARPAETQELKSDVLAAVLRHVVSAHAGRLAVVASAFPNPQTLRGIAGQLGIMVGNRRSDLVRCEADRRTCRIPNADKVVSLVGFEASADQVELQIVISKPVILSDGTARVFPEVREIVVALVNGRWTVTHDELLFRR